jgi:hypothetical protein
MGLAKILKRLFAVFQFNHKLRAFRASTGLKR